MWIFAWMWGCSVAPTETDDAETDEEWPIEDSWDDGYDSAYGPCIPDICGNNGPSIHDVMITPAQVQARGPGFWVDFLLTDPDGDAASQFQVIYDDLLDGGYTSETEGFLLTIASEPLPRCSVFELPIHIFISYEELEQHRIHFPSNSQIEVGIVGKDDVAVENYYYEPDHVVVSETQVVCTLKRDGRPADIEACVNPLDTDRAAHTGSP